MTLVQTAYRIGEVVGFFLRPLHRSTRFFLFTFYRGVVTSFYSHKFGRLGKNTMLSPKMWIVNPQNIYVGNDCSIARSSILETYNGYEIHCKPCLEIGNNVSIGEYCHITCCKHIKICDGVLFGRFVLVTDNAHGTNSIGEINVQPSKRIVFSKGDVVIGKNVWVGDKVTILPDVKIGDGCIVAANSVVTKDIPPYSVVAGVPAKIVKRIVE